MKAVDLYIIGPVTGIEDDNRPRFERARKMLEAAGYTAAIPHDIIKAGTPWNLAMWKSVGFMLNCARAAAVLPGKLSRGSAIELGICMDTSKPIATVNEWLAGKKSRIEV